MMRCSMLLLIMGIYILNISLIFVDEIVKCCLTLNLIKMKGISLVMAKCHPRGSVPTPTCEYLPCPMVPPGMPNPNAICAAPVAGCGPVKDFMSACYLHNYNCGPNARRKWTLNKCTQSQKFWSNNNLF